MWKNILMLFLIQSFLYTEVFRVMVYAAYLKMVQEKCVCVVHMHVSVCKENQSNKC